MNEIIFTLDESCPWVNEEYYPVPAAKLLPDWYKEMKGHYAESSKDAVEVQATQTMKRCMPVFDSIAAGYLIKTYTDVEVKMKDGFHQFKWAQESPIETITMHPEFQVKGYKSLSLPVGAPKIQSPWGIKTPKGYSCLFISPMHRPKIGITILEGVVDTDGYNASVQFPFLVDEGFEGIIPAGTPVVQVIPFKREDWKIKIGDDKERKQNAMIHSLLRSVWINGYRNKWRKPKTYL